tara:strand:- start:490 stop:714 length:225 start_codon:yes stop_codon:yes gene_type:complete
MDEKKHPHLRLINTQKEAAPPLEPEKHHYGYDPDYNYDLGMRKDDVFSLVIGATLVGALFGVVVVALWGGLSLL